MRPEDFSEHNQFELLDHLCNTLLLTPDTPTGPIQMLDWALSQEIQFQMAEYLVSLCNN